jgi:hypothetical protein
MDKLKIFVYQNGHRLSVQELYSKNYAFGLQKFLGVTFQEAWKDWPELCRSFDLEMSQEKDEFVIYCHQEVRSPGPSRKFPAAAFPRGFLERFLNKTLTYDHRDDIILQIHILEYEKDMVIMTHTFGTLAMILRNAIQEVNQPELEQKLLKSVGTQLREMFHLSQEDLVNSGFHWDEN